jgi:gluconolactonase
MTVQYSYREIATGLGFPEGPVVLPDGSILVCEVQNRCLTIVRPDGQKETVLHVSGAPNGAAVGKDGALYICNNGDGFAWGDPGGVTQPVGGNHDYTGGRIERIDLETGDVTELFRAVDGHPLLMPNDIVVDRDGGLWFTDHGMRTERSFVHGGLYYGTPDGKTVREMAYPITTANGVGLSPDETWKRGVYTPTISQGLAKFANQTQPHPGMRFWPKFKGSNATTVWPLKPAEIFAVRV